MQNLTAEHNTSAVNIVEVGPRDGLQNEKEIVSTASKVAFINKLADAGLGQVEVASFVHPARVPQLADAREVIAQLSAPKGCVYSALVPNMKGLDRAIETGIKRVAVFTAASETFTRNNINMTIAESLKAFEQVVTHAVAHGISVRGYISTCFVCPFEGEVSRGKVVDITAELLQMGVDQVAISDTIGAAAPTDVRRLLDLLLPCCSVGDIALHFHDTYGTALADVSAGLQAGVRTFDASAGGLGGCPYAPGASGNLATEDLVYMLHRMGLETGVSLPKLLEAACFMQEQLGRPLTSSQLRRMATQATDAATPPACH